MPGANPFANIPSAYNQEIPWYMGGGGSGGPLGPGAFPAAPALNQQLPPWTPQMQGSPTNMALEGPPAAPAMAPPQGQNPMDSIGAGIMQILGLGPNRAERAKAAQGQARSAGAQALATAIEQGQAQGIPANKIITDFLRSPQGQEFFANSNNPGEEVKQILGLVGSDPTAANRANVFGGAPDPAAGGPALGSGVTAPAGGEPGLGPEEYLAKAREAMALNDLEGAKVAIDMANSARLGQQMFTTDDITEYNFQVAQDQARGLPTPNITEWKNDQIRAGVQATNGLPIPDAYQKRSIELFTSATNAERDFDESMQMRELAMTTDTGWLASASLPLRAALQSIGIHITPDTDLADQQVLNSLGKQMALRLRNPESGFGLTGNTSNFDLQFLVAAVAGLDKLPEANYIVLTILAGRQRRNAFLDRAEAQWIEDNGSLKGWGEERKSIIAEQPLLTPEEQANILSIRRGAGLGEVDMDAVQKSADQRDENKPGLEVSEMVRPPVGGGDALSMSQFGEPPETFLPKTTDPAIRMRAWEIYNEDKAANPDEPVQPKSTPKGDRVTK